MKIAIIGAGNVGSLTAMCLAKARLGDIVLIDIARGLAQGKALDLEDASPILKYNCKIQGSEDIAQIEYSDIIIITAGLARRPGMSRQDLLNKNAQILKGISMDIKRLAPNSIIVVVTNPIDLMTYLVLKITNFSANKVFGMGPSLDAARFANLISKELNVPSYDIDSLVIGSHGEGMLPLARFTKIKGVSLDERLNDKKIEDLVNKTVNRGAAILSLLGSGSAYFAPSAAITAIVKAVACDEKRTLGVCAYLSGEYGMKDICIGLPCRLGKEGVEKIIELDLNQEEREKLNKSADSIRELIKQLPN